MKYMETYEFQDSKVQTRLPNHSRFLHKFEFYSQKVCEIEFLAVSFFLNLNY